MKILLILLTMAMLLVSGAMNVPQEPVMTPTDPNDFDASGYDGAWTTVAALDIEIFLPEGWTGEDVSEDAACYRAASADGAASLTILYPAEDVTGELASAGGSEARLSRGEDGSLTIARGLSGDRVAAFRFERSDEDALSESLALQIVGTCTDVW